MRQAVLCKQSADPEHAEKLHPPSTTLELSDTKVYQPKIRARLGTTTGDAQRDAAGRALQAVIRPRERREAPLLFFFITLEPRVE